MIMDWKKGAQYWDKCWNPVIGCKPVSEGCRNCYAASMAQRFPELQDATGGFLPHLPKVPKAPPKSGVVFAGNMTDLFGEWVNGEEIYQWISTLSVNAKNMILTKRAQRLRDLPDNLLAMDHVFYGITAENQDMLEVRASQLMRAGAKNKWVSIEPLLGQIFIGPYLLTENQKRGFDNQYIAPQREWQYRDKFDWVVVGAESGPHRRPCKIEWVEQIVEDCMEWGCPVFVKQLDIGGKLVKDIEKFPEHLRIRQVPWGGKE